MLNYLGTNKVNSVQFAFRAYHRQCLIYIRAGRTSPQSDFQGEKKEKNLKQLGFFPEILCLPEIRKMTGWITQQGITFLLLKYLKIHLKLRHLRNTPQIAHCYSSTHCLLLSPRSHTDKMYMYTDSQAFAIWYFLASQKGKWPCISALYFNPESFAVSGASNCFFSYLCSVTESQFACPRRLCECLQNWHGSVIKELELIQLRKIIIII